VRTGVWLWFLMLCLMSGRAGASDNILVLDAGAREVPVGDNGTGIPQPILDKVFDPFFTTKAVGKGSGLGLAIVRDMMNKRGGRVGLVSREGEGTVVSLFWPTAEELS
jgi:C4-dicarboxylate-specific signal transduction histidine kinase